MALSGDPSSLSWLLGSSEGGNWMVSHGPESLFYCVACTRTLLGLNWVSTRV